MPAWQWIDNSTKSHWFRIMFLAFVIFIICFWLSLFMKGTDFHKYVVFSETFQIYIYNIWHNSQQYFNYCKDSMLRQFVRACDSEIWKRWMLPAVSSEICIAGACVNQWWHFTLILLFTFLVVIYLCIILYLMQQWKPFHS